MMANGNLREFLRARKQSAMVLESSTKTRELQRIVTKIGAACAHIAACGFATGGECPPRTGLSRPPSGSAAAQGWAALNMMPRLFCPAGIRLEDVLVGESAHNVLLGGLCAATARFKALTSCGRADVNTRADLVRWIAPELWPADDARGRAPTPTPEGCEQLDDANGILP